MNGRRINSCRFLRKNLLTLEKTRLSSLEKLREKLIKETSRYMREAMEIHKQIEAFYALFADFSCADAAYIKIASAIFGE